MLSQLSAVVNQALRQELHPPLPVTRLVEAMDRRWLCTETGAVLFRTNSAA